MKKTGHPPQTLTWYEAILIQAAETQRQGPAPRLELHSRLDPDAGLWSPPDWFVLPQELKSSDYSVEVLHESETLASEAEKKEDRGKEAAEKAELAAWNTLFEKQNRVFKVVYAVHHPCEIAELPFKSDPKAAQALRDEIVKNVASQKDRTVQLGLNFEAEHLNPRALQYIFAEIDRVFYALSIWKRIREMGVLLEWHVGRFDTADELQPSARTVALTPPAEVVPKIIRFEFNSWRWRDSARARTTNGVQCRNKLEALVQTALHEFLHAILYVFCREKNGHDDHFRKHNHKVNGATMEDTRYYDLPEGMKWEELHQVAKGQTWLH